jgi:hypothetical protein
MTAHNPFLPKTPSKSRKPVLATDLRRGKGGERIVASNGELNASSKADFMAQVTHLMSLANTHNILTEEQAAQAQAARKQRTAELSAAFRNPAKHRELGETVADELYITQNREGIMRSVLTRMDVVDGETPTIKLRKRNLLAIYATSPSKCETQLVRDDYFYPVEYYIQARPYIEMQEIRRNKTDILEDKYLETLQAFMVQEDRIMFGLCNETIGQSNNLTQVFGSVNPTVLGRFRNQVDRWGINPDWWVIANDLWIDIAGDAGFQSLFEPLARHEIILTGQIGTILGMRVKSDAFRHPEHRVLNQGDMYVFGSAENLGTYTDRGGIETSPIDQAHEGIPGRGWMMHLQQSQTIVNTRAVAVGTRT